MVMASPSCWTSVARWVLSKGSVGRVAEKSTDSSGGKIEAVSECFLIERQLHTSFNSAGLDYKLEYQGW
jgi:hypothetical protein